MHPETVPPPSRPAVTQLLERWQGGEEQALAELTPILYEELHRVAAAYLRRQRPGHTLQATALIGEVYLRLLQDDAPRCASRAHFLGVAASCMRQILVDHARRKHADKRGGKDVRVTWDDAVPAPPSDPTDLLAADRALGELAAFDERKARIVEMRYFGGMSQEEIAAALGVHVNTVARDLKLAQAWLSARFAPPPEPR